MTKSVAYLFKYNFYVDVETNANRHRFQPLPPLILVIPPTAFVLPLPGRDVYSPPPTANLNNYLLHWSRAQIPPCLWQSYSLLCHTCHGLWHSYSLLCHICDTLIHSYVTHVTLVFTPISHLWHSYSLICHTCDTRIQLYVTPMTLVFTHMSHLWRSYSLICHTCDARIHSYVTPVCDTRIHS